MHWSYVFLALTHRYEVLWLSVGRSSVDPEEGVTNKGRMLDTTLFGSLCLQRPWCPFYKQ